MDRAPEGFGTPMARKNLPCSHSLAVAPDGTPYFIPMFQHGAWFGTMLEYEWPNHLVTDEWEAWEKECGFNRSYEKWYWSRGWASLSGGDIMLGGEALEGAPLRTLRDALRPCGRHLDQGSVFNGRTKATCAITIISDTGRDSADFWMVSFAFVEDFLRKRRITERTRSIRAAR